MRNDPFKGNFLLFKMDPDRSLCITINEQLLQKVSLEVFHQYQTDDFEFYEPYGKQHYRLLAYLSTLFKNSNIIDIGTHKGSSALALSYEDSNTIHTYDIINKIEGQKFNRKLFSERDNVIRHYENLWDNLNSHKEFLLSCPLIFVDIDPHEGRDELIFYYFMLASGYQGVLIFDDIHYFEGMRRFWSQVDNRYKVDLTKYGHFSGTGAVIFNDKTKIIVE